MPRRGRARRQPVVATLVTVLVTAFLASCTVGPSTRPPVVRDDGGAPPPSSTGNSRPTPLPKLEESRNSAIDWSPCGGAVTGRADPKLRERVEEFSAGMSCARITTALNAPGSPRTSITRLALLKVGNGPVPLAVVNDVNGLPGTLYAAEMAATLPPEMLEKFSLIGVDRRGTGDSTPVNCVPPPTRTTLLGHDPTTTIGPLLDAARVAGQRCAISLERARTALDSRRAASDLEELRKQLGVRHLNVLAHGEGSTSAAYYAARYPNRVGRVVLDGVPDPSTDVATVLSDMAGSAESTLDEFAADCARRDCPLGEDARAKVRALTDRARTSPLPTDNSYALSSALVSRAVLTGLGDPGRWPQLADAVAAGLSGDGNPLSAFVDPLLGGGQGPVARLDATLATLCNDTAARLPADRIRQVSRDLGNEHPIFGAVVAQRLAWCSPWPGSSESEPEFGSPEAPPIVVVSTALDPVTPEKGTIHAAERMPTAVRVAWQGTGHSSLGSACVAQTVRGFLAEGTVPRDGTLCPA